MWVAKVNKRVFNKIELKRGVRPVISHVGRTSGKTYQTPLDAHRIDGGFIFFLNYGSGSDWVRNIMAAGSASLSAEGEEYPLVSPRLLTKDEAQRLLPGDTKMPPDIMKVTEFLQMDIAEA
jgi:deazaflavin-dependent oxidoreductase (nitroreductase family)